MGMFPEWSGIVLLHKYYEQVYLPDAMTEIEIRRRFEADRLASSNSIAIKMLNLGNKHETKSTNIFGKHFEMLYFTEIDGEIVVLNEDQIRRLKNKWLILNEKRRISSRPFIMPQGGFYLSKRKAKKRGIEGVGSTTLVIEIKPAPEYAVEFRGAITKE